MSVDSRSTLPLAGTLLFGIIPHTVYKFSDIEKQDLLKAWLAITLAFSILRVGLSGLFQQPQILVAIGITVGLGFVLHELAHKFVAQRFGMWAEFRADEMMLILAILMPLVTSFVFAAPGAVVIAGYGSQEQSGKIALAGPLMNLLIAILFLGLAFVTTSLNLNLPYFLRTILALGFQINAWLALFNLIPFGPLDGAKILKWSQSIWLTFFLLAAYLTFSL